MSILKIKNTQGNWVNIPTVKGDTGNGISSAILNNDYTLTLTFTDGTTYTTPSIRGEKGDRGEPATDMEIHICSSNEYDSTTRVPTIANPNDKTFYLVPTEDGTSPDLFTEWVYVNSVWEMFGSMKIDLSGYLTDVTVNGTSIVTDGVADIPIAGSGIKGVVSVINSYGLKVANGNIGINKATGYDFQNANNDFRPIVTSEQHNSVFYGLAKAAGDTTQSQSDNTVGQYTDEAKASIQNMLDVPSKSDIPEVPVEDVQIDGTSIVANGVANVPIMDVDAGTIGVARVDRAFGTSIYGKRIIISKASSAQIKNPNVSGGYYCPIVPYSQHESVFYGLAKAASDTTQSDSSNVVGNYTDNAKDKIQNMLGITPLIAPHESDPFESNHVIGELFIIGGKLYRAKTTLTAGEYVNEDVNVEVVNVAGVMDEKVEDVKINGSSVVSDGVAEIPVVTPGSSTFGLVRPQAGLGTAVASNGGLAVVKANPTQVKAGTNEYAPIVPQYQHQSTFYGLAKASGDITQSQSSNEVGQYTDEAKTAIKTMLGVHDTYDSFIEEVTGTDPTIIGQPSYRYNCGEVYTLTITPPSSGTIDVRFTSGSSPTVLTLPSTVKMPEWWVEVEANTIYEMCITDGIYCGVMSWAI